MTTSLPVISCEGCGKCCEKQGTPPMYAMFFPPPDVHPAEFIDFVSGLPDDLKHFRNAPDEAVAILREHYAAVHRGEVTNDRYEQGLSCLWYDTEKKCCRFYEARPSVCRDFEVGGQWCLAYRGGAGEEGMEEPATS